MWASDSGPVGMDISGVAMDISTGLYRSSVDVQLDELDEEEMERILAAQAAELERTWGVYLAKCKLSPVSGFSDCSSFSLRDVEAVLGHCETNTLHDLEQQEELSAFRLLDHRLAIVWVAHCRSQSCCGVCIYAVKGVVGPSESPGQTVATLPEDLRRYIYKF